MWGNRLGWTISAVLVALIGVMVYKLAQVERVARPSGKFPRMFEPLRLPVDPAAVVPVMTGDCDAGEAYWQAIQHYLQNQRLYESFARTGAGGRNRKPSEAEMRDQTGATARQKLAELPKLVAVQQIMQGANCQRMTLFATRPQTVVHYGRAPELVALRRLGEIMDQVANYYRVVGKEDEAERYFQALFSVGAKLFNERVRRDELFIGLGMMQTGANGLATLAKSRGDEARAKQLLDFATQTRDYYAQQIDPLWQAVYHIDPFILQAHGGDVFALARNPRADRMWRVEAILKVGRYKYNAGRRGDQIGARREPQQWVNDPDPVVAAAARAARDLTVEDYRMLNVME